MKKFLTMIVALVASMFVGMTTTSCGNDLDDTTPYSFNIKVYSEIDGGAETDVTDQMGDEYKAINDKIATVKMTEVAAAAAFNTIMDQSASTMQVMLDAMKAKYPSHTIKMTFKMVNTQNNNVVASKSFE